MLKCSNNCAARVSCARASTVTSSNWTRCRSSTRRKNTAIDAVVDRLKVRADAAQRLAESFETALRMADGVARISFMDDPKREELVFSDKFACTVCGYSIAELEPKLFSFNNPSGACATCSGLGVQQFFDPSRVIHHPNLSIAGGAIRGWDRRNAYYFALMQSLSKHYKFDVEAPWEDLPAKCRKVVLYGSGEDKIDFKYVNAQGGTLRRSHKWEGVIPNLERRYRETESVAVREELSKYLSNQPCPDCSGTRLNRAARNVFVAERSLPDLAKLAVADALSFSSDLKLDGWRGEIAGKIVKEIGERLRFLSDVGLDYLTLIAAPIRCPAARRSVFVSRARSARDWSAVCTFSTSLRSACISATTIDCC